MTREELKAHCEKQIEMCKMWAKCKGEEPHGKVYEEHKLILELLEQETILDKPHIKGDYYDGFKNGLRTAKWRNDKIRSEMFEEMLSHSGTGVGVIQAYADGLKKGLDIFDKYNGKSEEANGNNNH